jgi:hypothetical protein
MIDEYGEFGRLRIDRRTELLGRNLPQCYFAHHKSLMTLPRIEPGQPLWEAND